MQRLVGGILIITATAGAGYVYGTELKKYLGKIQYLRYIVGLMKGEIEYTGAPLSEVFSSVARRVKEPYRNLLGQLSARTESREESGFSRIWNKCIDRYLRELNLKTEHYVLLKELGTFLGQMDRETFNRSMQLYLNRMDLEIEKLREGLAAKKKIGGWLGIMSGIFLVVILI